jgi:hypothetical protein
MHTITQATREMPRGNSRHRGDVIALYHYKGKSLEESVRRRVFGRRPNTAFKQRPKDPTPEEVSRGWGEPRVGREQASTQHVQPPPLQRCDPMPMSTWGRAGVGGVSCVPDPDPHALGSAQVALMEAEVAATVAKQKDDFLARAEEAEAGGVEDTFIRDYWLQHVDAQYWATRRYAPAQRQAVAGAGVGEGGQP